MERVKFSEYTRHWDAFSEFHIYTPLDFVQFESGVIINTGYKFDPHERNRTSVHKVRVTMPSDAYYDFFMNGEKIPTAWLIQGSSPYLMIDETFETNNVTRLCSRKHNFTVPENKTRARAISTHETERVKGGEIFISKPYKTTKEEQDWMRETLELANITNELDPFKLNSWERKNSRVFNSAHMNQTPSNFINIILDGSNGKQQVAQLATYGWVSNRSVTSIEHLTAKLKPHKI